MKKILANLALTGSLLITAAVLAPLFHGFDQTRTLGLLCDQGSRGTLATAEVVTRSELSTGLQDGALGNRGGQVSDLVCRAITRSFSVE